MRRDPASRRSARRRTALLAVPVATALLLAGCGGDDDGPPATAPTPTEALWNPCDALDPGPLGERLGTELTKQAGSPTEPRCSFTPANDGDPAVDANYLLFPEGLDAAWDTMGGSNTATVTEPRVRGAEATRLVVEASPEQLYVTGFVQNGDLIQTVDVVDPRPYDRARVEAAVTWVLGRLSAHAAANHVE